METYVVTHMHLNFKVIYFSTLDIELLTAVQSCFKPQLLP